MAGEVGDEVPRFRELGDVEAVIARGVAGGLSEARLRACIGELRPIFGSLSFGEQPAYDRFDAPALRDLEPEIGYIARTMAGSDAADLRSAGYHLMGALDSVSYIPDLERAVGSEHEWERIVAIRALGRMGQPAARTLVRSAARHPSLQTRRAASEVLGATGG